MHDLQNSLQDCAAMTGEKLKGRRKEGREGERESASTIFFRYTDIAKGDKEG